ncbi:2-oxoacid:ferredoxin oxidoreductase subunit beta [candidate division TA06 bacterium]|uniref:2-oxoacid:ferredoxin oxidoreductase subunit beta n=1 Tax=candidate division TA06 bacterium TaxID=2250710 RepID=A0A523XPW2_UNCT6|nr:MAG: 2-oxoacid:ferredoxin oxidoreductase subunit beta [candidate division TA06 bacterium]
MSVNNNILNYIREEIFPTAFCPGCGCGTVLNCFVHMLDRAGIDKRDLILVTGIGCSSWIPSPYLEADTLHTTHGRPIAFATGVKVMKPDKYVVVIAGDGDLAGIGGNHLMHAARRNVGLKVFLVNNYIYGMTGGQVAPTTPTGVPTTTTPYGNPEPPMNIAEIVTAAGADYVARWTTYHVRKLMHSMEQAMKKKGFSLIEIMSQCPVSYGKRVKLKKGSDMLRYFRDNSVPIQKTGDLTEEELSGKIVIGKLVDRERTEFTATLNGIIEEREKEVGTS